MLRRLGIGHRWLLDIRPFGLDYRQIMPWVLGLYVFTFITAFFLLNVRLSVEWVAVGLIGAAVLTGKARAFFRDWGVFIVAVVAWQVTDGLATRFNFTWHLQEMATVDRWMFRPVLHGQLPTVWLQHNLFRTGHLTWIDVGSVVLYSLHFVLPLTAAFALWLANRETFHKFATCFVIAAIAGFVTYIIFPAVPPWMAAQYASHCVGNGACYKLPGNPLPVIPWVYNIWGHTMAAWISPNHGNFGFGPLSMGYDTVGAMPSEHIMYPTLVFLFLRRQFGKVGYLMVPYTLAVLFSIVYMGQHWVIDGVVGAAYAFAVYYGVMSLYPKVRAYFAAHPIWNPLAGLEPSLGRPALSEEMVAIETAELNS